MERNIYKELIISISAIIIGLFLFTILLMMIIGYGIGKSQQLDYEMDYGEQTSDTDEDIYIENFNTFQIGETPDYLDPLNE